MRPRYPFLVAIGLLSFLIAVGQDPKQKLNDQLWEASRKGDLALVTSLLDQGADVNAKFRYGTTALFKAAERGHVDVVKLLLARGADASVQDTFYRATAMTWALQNDHLEVVGVLLEKHGAAASDVLMTGVREGKPALVELALAKGSLKPETLTSALAAAMDDKEKTAIADRLRKAGATPPMQLDAATLQLYAGSYAPEQGGSIAIALQEGRLVATPTGQRPITLIPLDKLTFKPAAFDGLTLTFYMDQDKVTGFSLKQGANTTVFKRAEQPKP